MGIKIGWVACPGLGRTGKEEGERDTRRGGTRGGCLLSNLLISQKMLPVYIICMSFHC